MLYLIGISLYTYHKYRKTIDSKIALDAHGNPIIDNNDNLTESDIALRSGSQPNFENEQLLASSSQLDLPISAAASENYQVCCTKAEIIFISKFILTFDSQGETSTNDHHAPRGQGLLFDVGDDADDAEDDFSHPSHDNAGRNGHARPEDNLPPPYTTNESESNALHKVWANETDVRPPSVT